MPRATRAAGLALLSLSLSAARAGAAYLYVAGAAGSDDNPGTSAAPFRTIQKGVDAAQPGDTIFVKNGTYYPAGAVDSMAVTINKAGTSSARFTLQAESKGGVILDGRATASCFISFGASAAYWTIRDFDFRNTRWGGIIANGGGGKNIVVQGNRFYNIGNRTESSSYGIFGIYNGAGTSDWTIDGNLFHDIGRTSPLVGLDHGIYTHGANFLVVNNVFYNQNNGRHFQTVAGFSGTIANNTFFGMTTISGKLGAMILYQAISNVIIRNNVFYEPREVAIDTYSLSVSGACSIDHNIVYHPTASVGLIKQLPATCTASNNSLNVDPKVVDAAARDFHLRSGSPAIDAGAPVSGVTLDFDGRSRPSGAALDLGAYESAGTALPLTISGVAASAITAAGATIGWTTSRAANGSVQYGLTTAYGSASAVAAAFTTSHSIALSGLSAGKVYHYRVKSADADGVAATSGDATFTTSASGATTCPSAASGSWQNVSQPAQSGSFTLQFDATPTAVGLDGVVGPSNGAASGFPSLAAAVRFNTTGTIDARNDGAYAASKSIPYAANATYHVRLVVDIPGKKYSAYVRQGTSTEQLIGSNFSFRNEQTNTSTLSNLALYAATGRLTVCNAAITAAAADTTPPVISAVGASGVTASGATIAWTTGEPATSQVEYGPTTSYGTSTTLNATLTTSHAAALSSLKSGTIYHYRVKSKDAAGNQSVSADQTFTTSVPAPTGVCLTNGAAWQNLPLATGSDKSVTVQFDATPAGAAIDGVMGLSNGAASAYTALAAAVRFNDAGRIDALNGGAYSASSTIRYSANLPYHFRLVVDVPGRKYSAYVRQGSNAEVLIGSNFAFRTQLVVVVLNNLGLYTSAGQQSVCNAVLAP